MGNREVSMAAVHGTERLCVAASSRTEPGLGGVRAGVHGFKRVSWDSSRLSKVVAKVLYGVLL